MERYEWISKHPLHEDRHWVVEPNPESLTNTYVYCDGEVVIGGPVAVEMLKLAAKCDRLEASLESNKAWCKAELDEKAGMFREMESRLEQALAERDEAREPLVLQIQRHESLAELVPRLVTASTETMALNMIAVEIARLTQQLEER